MLRTIFFGMALLLAGTALAHAERICDIEKRWAGLKDGQRLTIRGRITKSYGRDKDGNYSYDIKDSCGEAFVGRDRPIKCSGRVTISGEYDDDVSLDLFGQIAIWVTRASCK